MMAGMSVGESDPRDHWRESHPVAFATIVVCAVLLLLCSAALALWVLTLDISMN
jgi:hypothetical protein